MHAFSKSELTSEDVDAFVIDWIEQNCNQFYYFPIIRHAKRPRMRGSKIDYWETNWSHMLTNLESSDEDSRLGQTSLLFCEFADHNLEN